MNEPEAQPTVLSASGSVVGKVCPHCDEALAAGAPYLSCPACLAPQHAGCWSQAGACGSYFCRRETRREVAQLGPAAIVITRDEASAADPDARPAPLPRRVAPSPVPVRRDPYSTAALVMGLGALVPGLGCLLGPVAALLGALSLGRVDASGALFGRGRALSGLLLGLCGALTSVALLGWGLHERQGPSYDSPFLSSGEAPLPPPPGELENMPAPIRAAFRSNVFIEGRHRISAWVGSGIVVDATPTHMRVLTNRHVADGALTEQEGVELSVYTVSGQKVAASVLWRAAAGIDLALLEAALPGADRLVSVACAASRQALPAIGSRVFAVGNPHSLAWTYTEGVVSSLRDHEQGGHTVTFIQTQTPINPGNSGGGLYDAQGCLVGINSWKVNDAVGEGLSFAIAVRSILDQREGLVRLLPADPEGAR